MLAPLRKSVARAATRQLSRQNAVSFSTLLNLDNPALSRDSDPRFTEDIVPCPGDLNHQSHSWPLRVEHKESIPQSKEGGTAEKLTVPPGGTMDESQLDGNTMKTVSLGSRVANMADGDWVAQVPHSWKLEDALDGPMVDELPHSGYGMETVPYYSKLETRPYFLQDRAKTTTVGPAKIPLAVAGPLEIRGDHAGGRYLAPLAITEGAVVASTNRGASALNASGGVTAFTSQFRVHACPVFEAATPREAHRLGEWVAGSREEVQREVMAEATEGMTLKEILSVYDLQYVHLLLKFDAEEPVQTDLLHSLSSKVARWIAQKSPKDLSLKRYWKESHLAGDRKCSKLNTLLGQGLTCGAEAVIPERVLRGCLGVESAEDLLAFYQLIERASDRSLSMGANGNTANITSAIFAATGQDLGRCVDASAARTQFTPYEGPGGGVRYTLWMPSLVAGSKYNTRSLPPTQQQCLELMGCDGPGTMRKFAEIVASFAIALDVSTISSVVAGQFTKAHERLGKNRPT